MKKITFILFLFLVVANGRAQDFREQRNGFIAANIGINGVLGGIGALINIKKDEKPLKVFVKGVGQGCMGGAFIAGGKDLTHQIASRNNIAYAWPARITNSIGSSISQNAASNINFWERWHFELGVLRLDYHVPNKKFQARFVPSSLYPIAHFSQQAKFDIGASLATGIMVFKSDGWVTYGRQTSNGFAIFNSMAIDRNTGGQEYYSLVAHETMHVLQYENRIWLNPIFSKTDAKWKTQSKLYQTAANYIYFDLNWLEAWGVFLYDIRRPWECRRLEREADLFARRIVWPRCN